MRLKEVRAHNYTVDVSAFPAVFLTGNYKMFTFHLKGKMKSFGNLTIALDFRPKIVKLLDAF